MKVLKDIFDCVVVGVTVIVALSLALIINSLPLVIAGLIIYWLVK